MDINVNVDANAINKEITEAIAKSAIGKQLKQAIEEKVAEFGKSYDNPLKPIITGEIISTIRKLIQEKYSDEICKFVQEQMTEEFIKDILSKMWQKFIQQY